MRRALSLGFVLIAALASGCKTAVGNYFANRGRDFGECFRVEAGGAYGVQADAGGAGVLHVSLGLGLWPRGVGLGWVYGDGYAVLGVPDQRETFYELGLLNWSLGPARGVGVHSRVEPRSNGFYDYQDWAVLPVLTRTAIRARKAPPGPPMNPVSRLWRDTHRFDIEVGAIAGLVHVRAGFSPGEFLDFLLGWFGLDIAGDDVPWPPPEGK